MPAVAVRAQHATLFNFSQQILPAATQSDIGYMAKLVSQVIEFEDHWVILAAQLARVLAQVRVHVRSIAVKAGQSAARPFDPLVVVGSALG